jgi:hypothetical protein
MKDENRYIRHTFANVAKLILHPSYFILSRAGGSDILTILTILLFLLWL